MLKTVWTLVISPEHLTVIKITALPSLFLINKLNKGDFYSELMGL